jgi:hypothetical protein
VERGVEEEGAGMRPEAGGEGAVRCRISGSSLRERRDTCGKAESSLSLCVRRDIWIVRCID